MNKIKMLGYKVAFFNILAIVLIVFAISLMVTNQVCSNKWDVYISKERRIIDNIRMYQKASDYLTKKAFAYVDSGDSDYYRYYMREVNEIKRRETAMLNIKAVGIGKDTTKLLEQINEYSMELMALEEESMGLVRAGRIDKAREKLFSDEYDKKSDEIAKDVKKFESLVRANIRKNLNVLEFLLNFTFVGEIIISLLIIIVSPLRSRITMKLLYVDALTNMDNRVAYERYVEKNEHKIKGIVFLDVNDLKTANDTLSHKAGDELLISIAKCIKKVFNDYGRSYRISGDEFVVVLKKPIDAKALLNEFEKECEEASKLIGNRVSASCGFAIQDTDNPVSREDLYLTAEKNMYEAKTRFYEQSGNNRRMH